MAMPLYPPILTFTDGRTAPLGTIFCIGRNYRAHAAELKVAVPTTPMVFIKPTAAFVPDGATVHLPHFSTSVHHEVELVIAIGKEALDIDASQALDVIAGVGVGIDLTLRDIQDTAKKKGEPWAVSKGFRGSAPVSTLVPIHSLPSLSLLEFQLRVNDTVRQHGCASEMERPVTQLIAHLSSIFGLRPGDLIFTGTPEGVGPIEDRDTLTAEILGLVKMTVHVRRDKDHKIEEQK